MSIIRHGMTAANVRLCACNRIVIALAHCNPEVGARTRSMVMKVLEHAAVTIGAEIDRKVGEALLGHLHALTPTSAADISVDSLMVVVDRVLAVRLKA